MKRMFLVKFLFTISIIEICGAFDVTLTANVSPGGRDCFAHKVAANSQYELEYQVRLDLASYSVFSVLFRDAI